MTNPRFLAAVAVLIVLLYVVGLVTGNMVSRRLIGQFERLVGRIPLIKTTYQIGKQLASTMSLPAGTLFKRVVLVNYFRPGIWTIGFVTGSIRDTSGDRELLKIFVPTVPNPTSGTILILEESQIIDPGWSVEQAVRMVVSGGLIGPEELEAALGQDNPR